MPVYVALLRGINVGGHNVLPMADLRAIVECAGFGEVRTYIQSGNVVLTSRLVGVEVASSLCDAIRAGSGIETRVVVRTAASFGAVVRDNPFVERTANEKHLHVAFLYEPGDVKKITAVAGTDYAPDEVSLHGAEAYLYTPAGLGRSKLATESTMKRLGIQGTVRNWRTVTTLSEMTARM